MRVLLAVLLNLVLVTALTIASVHIQLIPQLNRLDWAYWVHKSLMLVCLAQFMMAAVWAATTHGGRFGLWANGTAGHLTRFRVYNTNDIFDVNVVGGVLLAAVPLRPN